MGLEALNTDSDGTVAVTPGKIAGQPTISGKVPLDPTQTTELLKNMQQQIDQRTGFLPTVLGGLKDALAVGQGAGATAERDRVKNAEEQQIDAMRAQMASYRSAQAANENAKAQLAALAGGNSLIPGAAGTASQHSALLNDPNVQIRMAALPAWDAQGRLDILGDAAKTQFGATATGRASAASSTPVDYMIPGVGPVRMTPNQFNDLPEDVKQRINVATLKQFGSLPGATTTAPSTTAPSTTAPSTTAPSTAAAPATGDASRIATNESGANPNVGYHDLSKSSAYGTYGITKAAYQDIQAANPKFKDRPITSLTPAEQTEAFNTYRQLSGNRLSQLGIDTTAPNLDLAHFLGADGAARFLKTGQVSDAAANANGGREKTIAIAQKLLGGQPVTTSPAAANQTAPLPPHPSTIAPVKPLSEWDDNTKPLPVNEWDDNTKMLPGQAAPAAAAPAAAAPAAAAPAAPTGPSAASLRATTGEQKPNAANYGSNYEAYKADLAAYEDRMKRAAEGIGTESVETAKQDTEKKNEYRNSVGTAQQTYDDYDRLFNSAKGHANVFNLAGSHWYGPIQAKITPKLAQDPSENHAIARSWLGNEDQTHFHNVDQGAAVAQASWAKNLVQGAGGRLTNADLQLGKPAKGVSVDSTYESSMKNLAQNMQDIRTAYYRGVEFTKWEKEHPGGTAAQFEQTPYYQVYSKVDAARDVAKKFADVPEVIGKEQDKYIHVDPKGNHYIVVNGQAYPVK